MKIIILFLFFVSSVCFAFEEEPKLQVRELTENVYQYTSYKMVEPWGMVGANGLIVVDGNDAHIIDTPWTLSDTKKLIQWIESKNLILKSAVVTHFHGDASGGISLLNSSKIKTYATPLTNKLLDLNKREKSSHIITGKTYELVPNTIEVFYPGAGHSQDNIVIWLPKTKVLFGGCFVKSIHSKNLGNTADASIKEWPRSIQQVINKYSDVKTVVPGHGKAGDISLLQHTYQLSSAVKGL